MHRERFHTLTASCPDRVGIIARVAGFIAEHQGWILESSYHADVPEGGASRYFMRVELSPPRKRLKSLQWQRTTEEIALIGMAA